MPRYFLDTNVLIDFGREAGKRERLEDALQHGAELVIAPPALIELTRGLVRGDRAYFAQNQPAFIWLREHGFEILPLPAPFMAQILKSQLSQRSGVEPAHYGEQICMVAGAVDFDDFLARTKGTVWRDIDRADAIHNAELDREFTALSALARRGPRQNYAARLSQKFGIPGCRPNPAAVANQFSAALEFLEASVVKIRSGAVPRRNDPGLYTDFQLLVYLGDPTLTFLTQEDFSHEIRASAQRDRIVGLDALPRRFADEPPARV